MAGAMKKISYVFVGGFLGTLGRYLVAELVSNSNPGETSELTWLYIVNLVGAFFFGVVAKHPAFATENRRNLWGVGFAGGFTTMSAITTFVDFNGLLNPWVGLMMLFGLGVYGAGYRLGRLEAKWAKNA